MSDYLIDYYHHRQRYAPQTLPEHDEKLKELIACFAIHLAARTARETHAWTVHVVSEVPYSLFVTGNTGEIDDSGIAHGFLVGHVLTEHIRHTDVSSIHAQYTSRGNTHTSIVRCDSSDVPRMVEQFYAQSEQHPLKISISQNSDTALGLVALPEYDEEWMAAAHVERVAEGDGVELHPMRTVHFAFECDCSPAKLIPFFRTLSEAAISELYGDDNELLITCPRCGKEFGIPRSEFEAEQ
jgi:redox-regulated HSP33 family molecular chaperone